MHRPLDQNGNLDPYLLHASKLAGGLNHFQQLPLSIDELQDQGA